MRGRSQSSLIPKKRSKHAERLLGKKKRNWKCAEVLKELAGLGNRDVRAKMGYFGVQVPLAHGISTPVLHKFAREIGKDHRLAKRLWVSGIHEAKILATLVGETDHVTDFEMDRWARAFDSWDVVDATCCYLYAHTKFAWKKVEAWSKHQELFIKRAGFSLIAYLSYKDAKAPDAKFVKFLRVIERESDDDRHFVKKAVNWALRSIGKRNSRLNHEAILLAEKLRKRDSRSARWIAADALRELRSDAVQRRLQRKSTHI